MISKLNGMMSDPIYDNRNKKWYTFLFDHIQHLREKADVINISIEDKNAYENRINGFLRKNQVDQKALWIIMKMNNFIDENDFLIRDVLLVPNNKMLVDLYRKFKTSQTKK